MNAEIIERLEWSFNSWPRITLENSVKARADRYPIIQRDEFEREVQAKINEFAAFRFPLFSGDYERKMEDAKSMFSDIPEEERERIFKLFRKAMSKFYDVPFEEEQGKD